MVKKDPFRVKFCKKKKGQVPPGTQQHTHAYPFDYALHDAPEVETTVFIIRNIGFCRVVQVYPRVRASSAGTTMELQEEVRLHSERVSCVLLLSPVQQVHV